MTTLTTSTLTSAEDFANTLSSYVRAQNAMAAQGVPGREIKADVARKCATYWHFLNKITPATDEQSLAYNYREFHIYLLGQMRITQGETSRGYVEILGYLLRVGMEFPRIR